MFNNVLLSYVYDDIIDPAGAACRRRMQAAMAARRTLLPPRLPAVAEEDPSDWDEPLETKVIPNVPPRVSSSPFEDCQEVFVTDEHYNPVKAMPYSGFLGCPPRRRYMPCSQCLPAAKLPPTEDDTSDVSFLTSEPWAWGETWQERAEKRAAVAADSRREALLIDNLPTLNEDKQEEGRLSPEIFTMEEFEKQIEEQSKDFSIQFKPDEEMQNKGEKLV